MNRTIILIVFAIASYSGFAQKNQYNTDSLLRNYSIPNRPMLKVIPYNNATKQKRSLLAAEKTHTATLMYANEFGYVYQLYGDNMPCLQPFQTETTLNFASIPNDQFVNKLNQAGKIPNPLSPDMLPQAKSFFPPPPAR
jgi:hypothetical protein